MADFVLGVLVGAVLVCVVWWVANALDAAFNVEDEL